MHALETTKNDEIVEMAEPIAACRGIAELQPIREKYTEKKTTKTMNVLQPQKPQMPPTVQKQAIAPNLPTVQYVWSLGSADVHLVKVIVWAWLWSS